MSFELMNMVHMKANDDLNANEVLVLMFLAGFANSKTGQCNPSQQTLADRTRLSRRTITRVLGSLEDKGYISRQTNYLVGTRCKATCSYIINAERIGQSDHTGMVSESIDMACESTRHGQTDHTVWSDSPRGMVPVAQEQGIEHGIEHGIEPKEKAPAGARSARVKKEQFDPKAMVVPDALNGEAWGEWVDYRTSIRKPITELSARKAVKMLTGYPHDTQQQMVDKSIQNGWQGLFPPDATRGRPVNQEAEAERKDELMRGAAILAAYRRPKIKREW